LIPSVVVASLEVLDARWLVFPPSDVLLWIGDTSCPLPTRFCSFLFFCFCFVCLFLGWVFERTFGLAIVRYEWLYMAWKKSPSISRDGSLSVGSWELKLGLGLSESAARMPSERSPGTEEAVEQRMAEGVGKGQ